MRMHHAERNKGEGGAGFQLPALAFRLYTTKPNTIYSIMARNTLVYLLFLVLLFFGFFSLLDARKAKADPFGSKVSYEVLKDQWVVAEAIDVASLRDLSKEYRAVAYQFLSSGGFVAFENKMIRHTGSWQVIQDRLQITYDGAAAPPGQSFYVKLVQPEEIVLQNKQLRFRLLRLKL